MKRNSFMALAASAAMLVFAACGSNSDDDVGGGEVDAGPTTIPGIGGSIGGGNAGTSGGNAGQTGGVAGQNGNAGQSGGNAGQSGMAGSGGAMGMAGANGMAGNGGMAGMSGRNDGGVAPMGTCVVGAACTMDCTQACTVQGQAGTQNFDCRFSQGVQNRDAGAQNRDGGAAPTRTLRAPDDCERTPAPRPDGGVVVRTDGGIPGVAACPANPQGAACTGACQIAGSNNFCTCPGQGDMRVYRCNSLPPAACAAGVKAGDACTAQQAQRNERCTLGAERCECNRTGNNTYAWDC